jgi:hypothetical protein
LVAGSFRHALTAETGSLAIQQINQQKEIFMNDFQHADAFRGARLYGEALRLGLTCVASLTSAAALVCVPLPATAAEGRWVQGFGQGNLEFFVDAQGMRLYLGCMTAEGSQSFVSLSATAGGPDVAQFEIKVAGLKFSAPFETASRVGSNNYLALLEALRKAPATVTYQGRSITFASTGAAQAIPAGAKATVCRTF